MASVEIDRENKFQRIVTLKITGLRLDFGDAASSKTVTPVEYFSIENSDWCAQTVL